MSDLSAVQNKLSASANLSVPHLDFVKSEIPHLPFVDLSNLLDPPPTPRALQLAVPTLATYPQAQRLGGFVDLAAIDPVPRPSQNLGPFALAHPAERTEKSAIRKPPLIDRLFRFLHRAQNCRTKRTARCLRVTA